MRSIRPVLSVAVLLVAVGLVGCSDSNSSSVDPDAGEQALQEQSTGTSGECEETDLTFTNSALDLTLEPDETAAVSLDGGVAYTAYAADFEIDQSNLESFEKPEIPEGGNLVTIFVTVFNATEDVAPVETGAVIGVEGDAGEHTFGVIHETADTNYGNSTDSEGSITVTGVGDTFCASIEYSDTQKSLIGTIQAPVQARF